MKVARKVTLYRSILLVPAHKADYLGCSTMEGPDLIVRDLEDGVSPGDKEAARQAVYEAFDPAKGMRCPLPRESEAIRVNFADRAEFARDVKLLGDVFTGIVVVPKANLHFLEGVFESFPYASGFIPVIGTASGASCIPSLSHRAPVIALGYDRMGLCADMKVPYNTPCDGLVRAQIALQARAEGKQAIDTPYLGNPQDEEDMKASVIESALFGYTGKFCLVPAQVAACRGFRNALYSESVAIEVIDQAKREDEPYFTVGGDAVVGPPLVKMFSEIAGGRD